MTQPRLLGGRYELDGVVGRGGMAEVYRARDIRLDRIVAVKTLRDDLARDQTFQARFRREAQSAASLNHPSIVAVYDTGEDMVGPVPVPYIVMEYVDGRTLRDLLRDDRRLLPERALEIVDGVLRALDYSHRNGIVHRDIKPGNVMLTRTGDVKVMDFGIARALSDSQVTMTQTAQVIGTAQYLSPEQARGERVDARSDLYSTGCLLYELLTGRPPFSGDSPVAIAYQHVRENPVPPSQVDPEIPRWADAIVLKAMAKSPSDRYQSAAEMRADIQRAMSGMPVSAPATEMTMVAPPTSAIPGYQYGPPEEPPRGGGRRRAVLWTLFALLVLGTVIAVAYLLLAGGGKKYAVPDVTGQTVTQATNQLVANHLQPQVIRQTSSTVAANHVISTNPSAGTLVPANSVVKVYVSAGQQQVTVPSVIGEDETTAQNKLQALSLNPQFKTVQSTKPANTVVNQHPPGGTKVAPNSTVVLDVSGGGTTVQSVIGDPVATAKSILQGQGFQVNEVEQPGPATAAIGTVYAQNPQGGTTAAPGATITIYVQPATPSTPPTSPTPTPTGSPTPSGTPSRGH
jgi:beta-lactam-binding protein with PASTA domain/tRNA A-37 threonylcarbamoyl transferase component Bud32